MILFVDLVLLSLLLVTAVTIAVLRDLFAAVMLTGIYGLLSASLFVNMGAADVAFTEAAVGAGISPLLMLSAIAIVGRHQQEDAISAMGLVLVALAGALLIFSTFDMPAFGSPDAPAHTHVSARYLEASAGEIGIPNTVASVLASYRGYDTMGEVAVVFVAGVGVLALLGLQFPAGGAAQRGMHDHTVLRVVGKILIPPILLFALYVQFHGEYGPGGGFQAGVIFAAAVILYIMLFGLESARRAINEGVVRFLAACGLLIYGATGVLSLLAGENYLDYDALAASPVAGQHLGIILVELGVGITVASVMILIFMAFTGRLNGSPRQ